MVFHVLNRGVGRRLLFTKDQDFLAFERVIEETLRTRRMRVCAYCLMPNHWHFVVWPERDGDHPAFMQQVTNTHVKRWKEHRHEIGYGHLYQGRYKCFPVETEDYFYQVVRYVERNALRANLVERAESWRWSSLRRVEREDPAFPILSTWPLPRPTDWLQIGGLLPMAPTLLLAPPGYELPPLRGWQTPPQDPTPSRGPELLPEWRAF